MAIIVPNIPNKKTTLQKCIKWPDSDVELLIRVPLRVHARPCVCQCVDHWRDRNIDLRLLFLVFDLILILILILI